MSKIQIEEVESLTTNGNLQITPNGTGVLKVSGDTDATLQLDDVKVKAPTSSAAQDYTLTLPTTNIAADRFLEVDSITGSGSTAVGQATFTNIPTPSASPLNATNFTSGQVPDARYSLPATAGAGFKLIQKNIVSGNLSEINYSSSLLEENTCYRLVGKSFKLTGSNYIEFVFLNGMGNETYSDKVQLGFYSNNKDANPGNALTSFSTYNGNTTQQDYFLFDFCTGVNSTATYSQRAYFYYRGMSSDTYERFSEYYGSYKEDLGQGRIYALKLRPNSSSYSITTGTQLLLYKYQEA